MAIRLTQGKHLSYLLKDVTMSKKIIDLVIYMDAVILNEGESAEDVINYLKKKYPLPWGYEWEINHEEIIDD